MLFLQIRQVAGSDLEAVGDLGAGKEAVSHVQPPLPVARRRHAPPARSLLSRVKFRRKLWEKLRSAAARFFAVPVAPPSTLFFPAFLKRPAEGVCDVTIKHPIRPGCLFAALG